MGVGDLVDEAGVDAGESGGVAVSDEGDLDRCGGRGESGELVSGEVSGEFDEDVDLLVFDDFDELWEREGCCKHANGLYVDSDAR